MKYTIVYEARTLVSGHGIIQKKRYGDMARNIYYYYYYYYYYI